jgi:DNA-binding NtrC family response regulator
MTGRDRVEEAGSPSALLVGEADGAEGCLGVRLVAAGFRVERVGDGAAALERVAEDPPDLVVCREARVRSGGLGWVGRLLRDSDAPVLLLAELDGTDEGSVQARSTGTSDAEGDADADRRGAQRFDVGHVGRVAIELVRERPVGDRLGGPVLTASQARRLRDRELCELLTRLLYETRGNIAEMARRIGKDRSTVRYHLKRFRMLGGERREKVRDVSPSRRSRPTNRRISD